MALLGFLRLWEVLVHILHCDKCPGRVVSIVDALDPRGFGWEPHCRMEVLECALYDWVLVDVVDRLLCFLLFRVIIEQLNFLQH